MLKKSIVYLVLLATTACQTYKKNENCDSSSPRWLTTPIYVKLDSSLSEEQRDIFIDAINFWNDLSVTEDIFRITDRSEVKNTIYGYPEEEKDDLTIAYTRVWYIDYLIIQSNIYIVRPEAFDKNVAIHELGHMMGLSHNENDVSSIMYPESSDDQVLKQEDLDEASCLNYMIKF